MTVNFVVDRTKLSGKELSLLKILETKLTEEITRDVLLPLITQTSPVSLRALDWTVTNWSKQHNVVCSSMTPGKLTNIHHSYRNMLSFWKRRLFDPFRRRSRCQIEVDGTVYETTLGQANFALWAYSSGTISYVLGHVGEIRRSMNAVSQEQTRT